MLQKYKIGAISKIMRIPIDTLRFYESKGLVTPKKDAQSGYRYYDVTDISSLLEYKRYRSMEISGNDALELLQKTNVSKQILKMEEHKEEIQSIVRHYSLLYAFQEEYCERLRTMRRDLYRFHITLSPEMYYFCNRDNTQFARVSDLEPLMEAWMQYIPFAEQFYRVRLDDAQNSAEDLFYKCGMSVRKRWAGEIGVKTDAPHVYYLPQRMAVSAVVIVRQGQIERTALQEGLEYIEHHKFLPDGDIFGNVLAQVQSAEGESIQYVELYYPIRE